MAECRHELDLCPDCEGLRVLESAPLEITGFTLDGANGEVLASGGPGTMWITPLPPCPNPTRKELLGDG